MDKQATTTITPPSLVKPPLRQRLGLDFPHLYFTTPAGMWALFVLVASLAPPDHLPQFQFDLADKIEHGAAYVMLGALILRAWLGHRRPITPLAVLGAIALASCWGMLMEIFQAMTAYRTFDWLDGLSNMAGATLGTIVWLLIARMSRNRAAIAHRNKMI